MGFRLIILAAMGLGALYMFHLLAQDYNKIRRPISTIRSFLRLKREVQQDVENVETVKNFDIDWDKILKYDPLNCLQSLACQLFAGAEAHNEYGENIKVLLQYSSLKDPSEPIVSAVKKGLAYKGEVKKCMKEYPYCFYSANTMLKILRMFSMFFQ
ncbi:unnamed protein product [Hermetia illucens]|uniref:Uncharacterized protein n=2 Tax=Hermetia illucens TaxID=343691 RepID=A0A7R8UFV8_HERIL|nr:unnamed protein product [Hermetia illucens]